MKTTLFDAFLAGRHPHPGADRDQVEVIKKRLRDARRFVLTDDATRHLGRVVRDAPEIVLEQSDFARAPFENTWIEYDQRVLFEAVMGYEPDEDGDDVVGFSILHDFAMPFVMMKGQAYGTPIGYAVNVPWPIEEQIRFCGHFGLSRGFDLDAFMWGAAYNDIGDDARRALRARHSVVGLYDGALDDRPPPPKFVAGMRNLIDGSRGDLRNLLAVLLLLNRPRATTFVDVARRRTFHRGKAVQYLGHSVVDVPLDPLPILRALGGSGSDRGAVRRHEVRGHWCQSSASRGNGCDHDWARDPELGPDEDPRDRLVCRTCGGKRWWRHDHARGSAAVGFVDQVRLVTSKQGEK